jgi:DNA-directed RNA polymerase specialized sigma24 family protein
MKPEETMEFDPDRPIPTVAPCWQGPLTAAELCDLINQRPETWKSLHDALTGYLVIRFGHDIQEDIRDAIMLALRTALVKNMDFKVDTLSCLRRMTANNLIKVLRRRGRVSPIPTEENGDDVIADSSLISNPADFVGNAETVDRLRKVLDRMLRTKKIQPVDADIFWLKMAEIEQISEVTTSLTRRIMESLLKPGETIETVPPSMMKHRISRRRTKIMSLIKENFADLG